VMCFFYLPRVGSVSMWEGIPRRQVWRRRRAAAPAGCIPRQRLWSLIRPFGRAGEGPSTTMH